MRAASIVLAVVAAFALAVACDDSEEPSVPNDKADVGPGDTGEADTGPGDTGGNTEEITNDEACDALIEGVDKFKEVMGECASMVEDYLPGGIPEITKSDCMQRVTSCTQDDRRKLMEAGECMTKLSKCDPNPLLFAAWGLSAKACYDKAEGLSAGCVPAL